MEIVELMEKFSMNKALLFKLYPLAVFILYELK
jgi:hypothetical protein